MYNSWIAKAEEDISAAKILLEYSEYPASIVCFHCQQATEKYFKAFLSFKNIEFPKIHDLTALLENFLIPVDSTFSEIKQQTLILTDYAINPRYPDFLLEFTQKDAEEAFKITGEIKNFIVAKFIM